MKHPSPSKFLLQLSILVFALLLSSCGGSDQISSNGAASPIPTLKTASTREAGHLTPTATKPTSVSENTAVLGGSVFAFDNKLGANNCCDLNGWDLNTMWVGIYTAEHGGSWIGFDEQSHDRVVGIFIHPYNSDINQTGTPSWNNLQIAKKICDTYLPPDAALQKSQVNTANDGTLELINVYYSVLLAHTLPTKVFTDMANHLEKPGLFFVIYNYDSSSLNKIDDCVFATDRSLQREDL